MHSQASFPSFLCPSDPVPAYSQDYENYVYAGIDYMVSYGSGTGLNYDMRMRTDGIVYANSSVRLDDVTDGVSHTIFMSESVRSTGDDAR